MLVVPQRNHAPGPEPGAGSQDLPSLNDPDEDYHQGSHEQNVDQPSHGVAGHQPESPEHK
jgi:hypothetical protein